jgi:transcriptional regulator with XRE-family HTH domain
MATVSQKLGIKIKRLRRQLDLTQEELAAKTKIDYSYINRIENGKRNPSIEIVAKIARALGVSLDELVKLK